MKFAAVIAGLQDIYSGKPANFIVERSIGNAIRQGYSFSEIAQIYRNNAVFVGFRALSDIYETTYDKTYKIGAIRFISRATQIQERYLDITDTTIPDRYKFILEYDTIDELGNRFTDRVGLSLSYLPTRGEVEALTEEMIAARYPGIGETISDVRLRYGILNPNIG